jgi:hypothetical protein
MIREVLDSFVKASARRFEGRENTVGASEIGQCARKVFFTKNEGDWLAGRSRDQDHVESWGATVRGRLFEDHVWVPALRTRYGDKLLFAGDEQRTLVRDFLSATPDGLIIGLAADALTHLGVPDIGEGASVVVEAKTIDPRVALDRARPEHVYQAIVQMGLLRDLSRYQPEWAVISYANASFLDDVFEFPIRFDPVIFANAKARAAQIMTAKAPDDLRPEGWISGAAECGYCPFTLACGRMRHAVPTQETAEPPDPQFLAELADLAREAKSHRADMEAATTSLREIEHEIRERLRSRGLRRIDCRGASITWSQVKGRPSYDMPAIREAAKTAGIDLTRFETVGDPTDRLTIRISQASHPAAA